ncbi:MAG: neutral/alkaline non-lysosomal ceramidase N-terminal domain-containing protein, partial [Candidatus Hydrogenedentes bacterium]|nr:neutral/alkaline non-lysosomal ceramidase N-terminal domain-containing protein [Candidatus Hydrogenedentota bacterium]
MSTFQAGAAAVSITPSKSLHLFGYPHVPRMSTGVHDPLMASALYLKHGDTSLLFVANDIIFIPNDLAARVRRRIAAQSDLPIENICITATHTHSGPDTVRYISNEADPSVPPVDEAYLRQLEEGIVDAARTAIKNACPAELGTALADGSCVGGNRRDPVGPRIPEIPVVSLRNRENKSTIALMLICSMHPTVLHEDSSLISGDFPGLTRQYLQKNVVGTACPVLHHTGACGNQSPRHVTRAN